MNVKVGTARSRWPTSATAERKHAFDKVRSAAPNGVCQRNDRRGETLLKLTRPIAGHVFIPIIPIGIAKSHAEVNHKLLADFAQMSRDDIQPSPRFIDACTGVALLKGGGDAQWETNRSDTDSNSTASRAPRSLATITKARVSVWSNAFFFQLRKDLSRVGHGGHRFGRHKTSHVQRVESYPQQTAEIRELVLRADRMRPSLDGVPRTFYQCKR